MDQDGYLWYFVPAAALHELGHVLMIRLCGGTICCVELAGPGVCMTAMHPRGYCGDLLIAAGGPAMGLAAGWMGAALGWTAFSGANILLTVFNSLPILPLDGGCMMVSLLCMTPVGIRGEDVIRAFSRVGAAGVALIGLVVLWQTQSNAALLVIGLILLFGNESTPCKQRCNCV